MERRSLTPHIPTYASAQFFLRIIDGVYYSRYRAMFNSIWDQRGNPQDTVNWSTPEKWITERLNGENRQLALRLLHESNGLINPRYTRGVWYLSDRHNLIAVKDDVITITDYGKDFIKGGKILTEIDVYEGLLLILNSVAEKESGKRSDYLEPYTVFCHTYTNYQAEASIKSSLSARLVNLIARGYVEKNGSFYQITNIGLRYLQQQFDLVTDQRSSSLKSDVLTLVKQIGDETRAQLEQYLQEMNPYKFEELIKFLLEEMGYSEVKVTSPTNDKGVDVVADIELGITRVREVIQVKRQKGNIQRTILDGLRGSLHRFDAVRATIITIGGFSKGTQDAAFEKGAAPITLIDGEKLIDLLIQYEIGVSRTKIEVLEFDSAKLQQFELDEELKA